MSWQPITTAPKDGTEILVRYPMQDNVKKLVYWNKVHGYWENKGMPVLGLDHQRADWHPLPPDGVTGRPHQSNSQDTPIGGNGK